MLFVRLVRMETEHGAHAQVDRSGLHASLEMGTDL